MADEQSTEKLLQTGAGLVPVEDYTADMEHIPMKVLPPDWSLVIPDAAKAEQWLDRPLRKKGIYNMATADSFARYFNEHKDDDSRIFATIGDDGATFFGKLNFHGKLPAFGDHECRFTLKKTREWQEFITSNCVDMTQDEFASFLEEHADLFVDPSGADLLELVSSLEGTANVYFRSALKLQNRTVKLSWQEETGVKGGDVTIPSMLTLGIAPFEGTAPYRVQARLKYKIEERKLSMWYEGVNLHLIVRQVCADVLQNITKQTGVEPFLS